MWHDSQALCDWGCLERPWTNFISLLMQKLFKSILENSVPLSACKIKGFAKDCINESMQDNTSLLFLVFRQYPWYHLVKWSMISSIYLKPVDSEISLDKYHKSQMYL